MIVPRYKFWWRENSNSFLFPDKNGTGMLNGDVHSEALCGGWKCHLPGQQEAAFILEYVLGGYLKHAGYGLRHLAGK